MNSGAYLYILRCADGSYYVGTTRKTVEERLAEHKAGLHGGYTVTRRPVVMVYAQHFETITDAVSAERQVKGWSRAKKEAMIKENGTACPNWQSGGIGLSDLEIVGGTKIRHGDTMWHMPACGHPSRRPPKKAA